MYVVIVGGGKVGSYLAKRLVSAKSEVLLVEKNREIAEELRHTLGDIILHGDGCEAQVQKVAGFQRADVVAAVTGEDEDNLIVCQMARNTWGVQRTVARVNDPSHTWLFRELGISATVSATDVLYNLIEQEITPDEVIPLAALKLGKIELVEVTLTSRSSAAGKRVRDLELPPKTNMIWLLRGEEGLLVDGETRLQAGDTIVMLVPTEHEATLREIF